MAVSIVLSMALTVGCGGTGSSLSDEDKEPIVFGDTQFQTLWINNAIAQFIIENGYGYPVDIAIISTPIFMQSIRNGDIDVHLELWRFNDMDWYEDATESGDMIDVGPIYDRATQGWYVPRYVIEGCDDREIEPMAPDLESVFDLADYWEVFRDPEDPSKGVFLNSIFEWDCTEINDIKLEVYGLAEYYNVQYPGGAAALDAALAGAYERGEPIVAYYWEPTWILGKYDFVALEEPEFDEDIWREKRRVLDGEIDISEVEEACGYMEHTVNSGIHYKLKERAPEVVEFLKAMHVGTDALNETAAYMEVEGAETEEAAIWYFENYQEKWRSWVPEDVEQRVEEALIEAGADL